MLCSTMRFMLKGWIYTQYVEPKYYFSYYGFSWIKPLGEVGMYLLFFVVAIAAFCIMLGWKYRFFSLLFFLSFTYIELIDKTNYLNHYYFVSLVSFLLMFVPANRAFSLDVWLNPKLKLVKIPFYTIAIFKLQLGMVYFFAGIAKLHYDWLFRAMPLAIWLPPKADSLPIVGKLFQYQITAYLFSWFGALYDLFIVFFLLNTHTRYIAYFFVVSFHIMTALLFPIGMFPYIMIVSTLIFFPASFHKKIIYLIDLLIKKCFNLLKINNLTPKSSKNTLSQKKAFYNSFYQKVTLAILAIHFLIQSFLPFRYLLYDGNVLWHEQGFRFSWRVMLIEKDGYAVFHVKDAATGKKWDIHTPNYLNANQEKMMSTQPDMILQFAHFLAKKHKEQDIENPEITVDCYVTLNGKRSRPFIDNQVNLATEKEGIQQKTWVLPFEK